MAGTKLVGLSVSFCVKAICQGKVAIEDVAFIVPGFVLSETNTKRDVWEKYKEIYWKDFPEKAWEVLEQVEIKPHPSSKVNIAAGCWMRLDDYSEDMDLIRNADLKIHIF